MVIIHWLKNIYLCDLYMFIFAVIDLFFLLLIGVIVFVSWEQKNFKLSLGLNLALLVMIFMKMIMYLFGLYNNWTMCDLTKKVFCN